MRMLSGRMHWLMVGLALLVGASGFTTKSMGQMPTGGLPGGMRSPDAPMSMSFPGPAPGEVVYAGARGSAPCDGACGGSCGGGCGSGYVDSCGGACGGACGSCSGGGPLRQLMSRGGGCPACGGHGCGACGGIGGGGNGCLFSGRLAGLLGPLAPYSEGGRATTRWFDAYVGSMVLSRNNNFGGFQTAQQDPMTGVFARDTLISTNTANGATLRTSDLDLEQLEAGLETIFALQTGPGTSIEARYFGLNSWDSTRSLQSDRTVAPTLFSAFSLFGTSPPGGFDDTDRSYTHTLTYESEIHNGEVNYRRGFVPRSDWIQGSWLAGIRYFDLDERMGFATVGTNNNTSAFDQLRFSNFDVRTRNQLTGVQFGGDMWVNVQPGVKIGVEGKGGIFGNHHEVEHTTVANSIARSGEFLQGGETAYLTEFSATLLYRLSYSWTLRGSYNMLYVDNVALAPENFNVRDYSNVIGGGNFTAARAANIDVDGEVFYQGFSVGGEFTF